MCDVEICRVNGLPHNYNLNHGWVRRHPPPSFRLQHRKKAEKFYCDPGGPGNESARALGRRLLMNTLLARLVQKLTLGTTGSTPLSPRFIEHFCPDTF